MFRRFSTIAMAAAMLLTASCSRENLVENGFENDGRLKFSLSMSGSPASVLEAKASSISTEDGSFTIPLNYERCDGIESSLTSVGTMTKGTQYNSADQYSGSTSPVFSVVAWNSDTTPYLGATNVTYSSDKWIPASSPKWEPESDVKTFLAWANAPAGAGIDNDLIEGNARQTFTYTVPGDARQQNDVMLGWYKGNGGGISQADITMVHPLTAIKFKLGEMDMIVTAIKSISIEGLLKTGEATVTYSVEDSQIKPTYSWVTDSATQIVTLAPEDGAESLEVDDESKVIGEPFIVLPQEVLAHKVKLSVVLSIGGTDRTLTAYIPEMEMNEGQTNVFTIGYAPYGEDALPGEFSVSDTKKVRFSRGNVQAVLGANKSVTKWQFAAHQYDFVGDTGGNISMAEGTVVDLFGWSGLNKNVKWGISTSENWEDYSESFEQLTDWGLNYGDGSLWKTMTKAEWEYLFNRSGTNLKKTGVTVCGITGCLVLAPDGFEGTLKSSYNEAGWTEAENQGLVCLPPAGYRITATNISPSGVYWTSTPNETIDNKGYDVRIDDPKTDTDKRNFGRAVRLVTEVKQPTPKVKFIDLDLPSGTLWANMNVGAKSETDIGYYFAWGETEARGADWATSKPYTWANAPFNNGSSSYNSSYFTANLSNWVEGNTLKPEYDAAHAAYGGDAYMPTTVQIQELIDNTNMQKIDDIGNGKPGLKFKSKSDDSKYILIPCGGWRNNNILEIWTYVQLWSSTLYNEYEKADAMRAYATTHVVQNFGRCIGMPVRAVKSPAPKPDLLSGVFSISPTEYARFSSGNLQATYNGSGYTFAFAPNQYDYVGGRNGDGVGSITGNNTIDAQTVGAVVDLFGWSTSNTNYGINTAGEGTGATVYGGEFKDWGTAIDDTGKWCTLSGTTSGEWVYLLEKRTVNGGSGEGYTYTNKASGIVLQGNTYYGLFIYPDDYDKPLIGTAGAPSTWEDINASGIVFLPAGGYRYASKVESLPGIRGSYWASTEFGNGQAYDFYYISGIVYDNLPTHERCYGFSVRLVQKFEKPHCVLSVTGEVRTNYNVTNGPKEYKVKSGSPWKLQYTLDGETWLDAKAGKTIDGWISFDKVSGIASEQEVSVTATVAPATSQTSVTVNHNANLRNASYKGQNSDIASQQRPYDLSTHDIYGNPTPCNTANCYVISGPGLYAFPLVYGNAIKNGADNKQAYAPTAASSSATYLTPFQGATGGITSRFIEGVKSVAPLWEDVANWALVGENACKVLSPSQAAAKGLTAGCAYVMFEVKADNLTPGNAVIAVKNSSGTILWSWHIWVTDLDLNTVAVTNNSSQTLNVMPFNLGWSDTENTTTTNGYEGKVLKIRFYSDAMTSVIKMASRMAFEQSAHNSGQSPTYQWGRKDPFIRAKDMSGNKELAAGEYSGTNWSTSSGNVSSAESIKHPTYLSKTNNWSSYGGKFYNLWSAQNTTNGTGSAGYSSAPVKTVYDPCPPGFQVPQANAFSHFSTSNHDDTAFATLKGYNFYTKPNKAGELLFFPATGYRDCAQGGQVASISVHGIYWSAAPSTTNYSYGLYFLSGYVEPLYTLLYRDHGLSVRPVKE